MGSREKILPYEAALGFKTCLGLSRETNTSSPPEVCCFVKRLKEICAEYAGYQTLARLCASRGLKKRVRELLDELGQLLWPNSVPPWLFDPSDEGRLNVNFLSIHYPRHPRYSNPDEQAE
jgi:hypothetical protein